jgi:diguanylate cyclase (GGDEF)-like protein
MLCVILSTLGLLAGAGLAAALARLSRVGRQNRLLEQRAATLERELAAVRRQAAQTESDQAFLARFVRELPHLAHELHAEAGGRQIPRLLLGAVTRLLEPRRVVVVVRRRPALDDPERHLRLAVAATSPAGFVELGTEIPIGRGEIGYAAETRNLMDRRDFDNQPPPTRMRLLDERLQGFQPDVVAPMVFKEEVVGAIAVEGIKRTPTEGKDVLRLLAQVGAASMHAQAQFSEMRATASLDGLTGIYNKRYLTQRLADEMVRAVHRSSPLSIFIFDLDHFKHYNDRNGHVAGDRLLQSLARLVQDNMRKNGVFGRYGGEEFLIVFPDTTRSQALAAAENVRQVVAAHEFSFGFDQPLGVVSLSGGVAECPLDGADAATLVRSADEALYRAKRAGRNRVLAYEPTYLGEGEAQQPSSAEQEEEALERVALEEKPAIGGAGEALALAAEELSHPGSTLIAADFTPAPGTLFALAAITPAAGVPRVDRQPSAEALAMSVTGPPEEDPLGALVEAGPEESPVPADED